MGEFTIEASGLVKRFDSRRTKITAIDNLFLNVDRGETFGLIGPDGAGKTTTTRVLLGLLKRSAGTSRILGFDSMRDTYRIRERVGYIAQQFVLPSDLTVLENMHFFAGIQGVDASKQNKRIPELLRFAGLEEFQSRLAGQLSGGMKKKLALACSLIHEPEVVLLDEPTLGVDPVSRREFWNLLGSLRVEKGTTIFVCTPYMDEAERCSRVGLLYAGRMIACGSPAEIKSRIPGCLLGFTPLPFPPALRIVEKLRGVLEVQTYGAELRVFVEDPMREKAVIVAALSAQGITCSNIRPVEVRMEEAFISLIGREATSQGKSRPVEVAQ